MKVALESSSLFFKDHTGIPFYIRNIYQAMTQSTDVDPVLAFRLKKKFGSMNDFQKGLLKNRHVWHLNSVILSNQRFEVVHSLHTPFLNIKKSLKIATIHDLAVHLPQFETFDFATEYFKKKRFALLKQFAEKADVLITVSEATKRDFLHFFDFPENKIHSVPLAPSMDFSHGYLEKPSILSKLNVEPKTYFISLGGISLRKNTYNLIKAYHLSQSKKEYKLVVTGKVETAEESKVREYLTSHKLENNVIITNYLKSEDLRYLYLNAKAFLFPTFYEGFGIPIIEAMASNLPVLTSNTGAAPETAGGHAILVDPFDPQSISEGIDQVSVMDEIQLKNAKAHAQKHTWERTAGMTTDIYRKYM